MNEKNIFPDSQHGFWAGRSCLNQLPSHFDKILSCLEQGLNVDMIYLDFSKVFDKVDHKILMGKLKAIGIGGKLAKWIHSFLIDRKQVVLVNSTKSECVPVKSGVPQGSVLGPLLFIIMMMDIEAKVTEPFLSCFADDTRLSKEISSLIDTFKLQRDLNMVYDWASSNNMLFNNCKFEHVKYGRNKELKNLSRYITIDGKLIADKDHVKDLGVIMSSDCTFSQHIGKLANTAKDLSVWCLRTFNDRSTELMLTLWKALILPRLDYCSQLWSPHCKDEIRDIEMTQRSYIRKINGMSKFSYWEQLKKLKP